MTKKRLRIALTAVLAVVFVVSAVMTIRQQIQYRESAAVNDEAKGLAQMPEPVPTSEPTEEPRDEYAEALLGLDLAALQEVNEDVVGWIEVPGTVLSYPIVQGPDNDYYLRRTWQKTRNAGGSIFLESTNERDLSEFHTLIYGHRMNNDTMFGTLKYYADQSYWQEHPRVYVVHEGGVYCYDIFAAYEVGVRETTYRIKITKEQDQAMYIDFCLDKSVLDTGVVPEPGDRILTLSTCVSLSWSDQRWVVQGRLAEIYTEDGLTVQ